MGCEHCLNRRAFLAKTGIAAAAIAVLEACGDGQIGPTAVALGGGITIRLSDFPELANTGELVDISHQRAVMRTGTTTFEAHSKICTHEGCETDVTNNRFECPCHGSRFNADGSVINGPNTGGQIAPLPTLATTFDAGAGTLTVA
ncbi:MAG TPA: Rieske 2Fe-2S domain-containing protein [Gemmatimonadaceae bacterium]|jgi:Rieske Fe-S protein